MLGGDAVQGPVYLDIDGSLALCPTYLHVDTYLTTIRYFESLPMARLAICHWPLKTGPEMRNFLSETRQFVGSADPVLLEELRAQEHAVGEKVVRIDPTVAGDHALGHAFARLRSALQTLFARPYASLFT